MIRRFGCCSPKPGHWGGFSQHCISSLPSTSELLSTDQITWLHSSRRSQYCNFFANLCWLLWKFMWKRDGKEKGTRLSQAAYSYSCSCSYSYSYSCSSLFWTKSTSFRRRLAPLALASPIDPSVLWVNKIHKRFLCGTNTDKTPNGHITLLQSMWRHSRATVKYFLQQQLLLLDGPWKYWG